MSQITVAKILANREQINTISKSKELKAKQRDTEIRRLKWDVYEKKIDQIKRQRDQEIEEVTTVYDNAIAGMDKTLEKHYVVIQQAKRIIEYLRLDAGKALPIADEEVELSRWSEPYKESLGYLFDDDYLKVKAFIIGNRKPKNKYSLIAVGRSIFGEDLIKFPSHSYGIDIMSSYRGFAVLVAIKDTATVEELKTYYAKRKDAILKDTLTEYQKVKAEYLEVKQSYKVDDFRNLITWACPKCGNFETTLDNLSANYTPQCYRHEPYLDMVAAKKEDGNGKKG